MLFFQVLTSSGGSVGPRVWFHCWPAPWSWEFHCLLKIIVLVSFVITEIPTLQINLLVAKPFSGKIHTCVLVFYTIHQNRVYHPGHHCWGCYPGTLSCSQVTASPRLSLIVMHYGNQSNGYLMRGGPLWPPTVPRLAARSSQSNPRGSGPEVLKRERGHVTTESGVSEVGVLGTSSLMGLSKRNVTPVH